MRRASARSTHRFDGIASLLGWLTLAARASSASCWPRRSSLQLEHGTYRLDWTQSITRRRWIAGKLGLAVGVALVASLAFIALVTWWRAPLVHLDGRMDNGVFDSEGIVAVGYTLFALGLALAIGVVWRRAVAGVIVAFGAYFVVRLFVDIWLRQRLDPADHTDLQATRTTRRAAARVGDHGGPERPGREPREPHVTRAQFRVREGRRQPEGLPRRDFHAGYMHAVYEPASRFWSMQLVESGLFAGAPSC